ncbi:MAG: hypothetical protein WC755_04605 [Candidatus Woesearchaeota archaeon]|jgi:inorganic pyrophosphatase/exopolyphosphatase
MSKFFYSKSTGLYVSISPLKIDSRVKKAAEKEGIVLNWDDEGRINNIDFDDSKNLLKSLNSCMLTPIEYWKVLKDAKELNCKEMFDSLVSDKFCEWLDRVYLKDNTCIDHSNIVAKYSYAGKKTKIECPFGRPGWMNPENNINYKTGHPIKVNLFREKFVASWKYWSLDFKVTKLDALAPIRGYITSVGKPSLDLGIPVDNRQPMLMVRECRKVPLTLPIKQEILDKLNVLLETYVHITKNLTNKKAYDIFYSKFEEYVDFSKKYGVLFRTSNEVTIYKAREQLIDILGLLKIIAISKNDKKRIELIDFVAKQLFDIDSNKISLDKLVEFAKSSETRLIFALKENKDVVFVMGHKNPDADTCICCLFESYRNSLVDKKTTFIPIIQSHKIPDEVIAILGKEISNSLLLHKNKNYKKAIMTGLCRWISVDQNREPLFQKYFVSIIDHHIVSDIAKNQDLPKTLELTGSCTALVTNKLLGMGLYFDEKIAKILYGATLLDTENRVLHKMTIKDSLIMDYLKQESKTQNDDYFYGELMSYLLNTNDSYILFKRDYKEDWGFGFAVVKVKHVFDKSGNVLKKQLISKILDLANKNNIEKNLPLTIIRITDYEDDNDTVNRERVYLTFNKNSTSEFIKAIFDVLENHVLFEFGNNSKFKLKKTAQFIEFWGTGLQLSRKKTAPILEPVVKAFNEYFYSPSIKLWIKRDFLKATSLVKTSMKKVRLKISKDNNNRINYITYPEAKKLLGSLSYSMLSLREYWLVLNDAKKIKDIQMIKSLQGSNFVEFLDTIIKNKNCAIEHPKLEYSKLKGYLTTGKEKKVFIPKGNPGLIHPKDIDLNSGIPKIVRKPNEYGNPELWRYWEPDSNFVIPTRSYIFVLKQPCFDGKFHIDDSFPNLGIRPCSKKVTLPKVVISKDNSTLIIKIVQEGDVCSYFWKR